jgi:hypothetical protein
MKLNQLIQIKSNKDIYSNQMKLNEFKSIEFKSIELKYAYIFIFKPIFMVIQIINSIKSSILVINWITCESHINKSY